MEKIVEQGLLYDFYGELLTKHQQSVYEDVVFNDLSLSEIADEQGITLVLFVLINLFISFFICTVSLQVRNSSKWILSFDLIKTFSIHADYIRLRYECVRIYFFYQSENR